jgi:L,D-transpeptidase ErfK/SrfK
LQKKIIHPFIQYTLFPFPFPKRLFQPTYAFHFCVVLLVVLSGCSTVNTLLPGKNPDAAKNNIFIVNKDTTVLGELALLRSSKGDTLPDIARHFGLGLNTVSSANPGLDIWVPQPGSSVLLPSSYILPDTDRKGIVINLPALRLFHYTKNDGGYTILTFPIGAGTAANPTPMGKMFITHKKHLPTWYVPASIAATHLAKGDPLPSRIPPGPLNPLGEYAMYLSKPSYLIHGTNKPASVGLRASNGCIRLFPEDIQHLFKITAVKTPVLIVNQPYLIGQRDQTIYLEAHSPLQDLGNVSLKELYVRLTTLEQRDGLSLNWDKVDQVVTEAKGIPVAISGTEMSNFFKGPVYFRHPKTFSGQPQIPPLSSNAWYVLAGVKAKKDEAVRLAAIINHQGPQIPARVLTEGGEHRILAGPFDKKADALKANKRLEIDLNIKGVLITP